MNTRRSGALAILAFLVAALSACSNSETPTEPGRAVSTSGTVHVILLNASARDLGLPTYFPAVNVIGPVVVKPGESIEMKKWNFEVKGDDFLVFEPPTAQTFWRAFADVSFNVRNLPTSTTVEISVTVRVTADGLGTVTAVSDRPDVIEIVSVKPVAF
ncbi:MAG TPA: hypothetical protein VMV60_10310 [Thermoanaerobaculia bacterium]|nr:hypothetical protein [Thermoanaerobaculia bacterium]